MENKLFLENIESQKKKKAIGLIHRVYLSQLINSRKYLASTKTKSEVRGGGRKPWRQKGTGRARAGSLRSPLFVGGGVIFGPKPRLVTRKINKKERRLAVLSAVSLKKNQIQLVEENTLTNFNAIKTKEIVKLIKFQFSSNLKSSFYFVETKQKFLVIVKKLKKCGSYYCCLS